MKSNNLNFKKTRNYLTFKLGFTHPTAELIIKRYGTEHLQEQLSLAELGDKIQGNWDSFMGFWGKIKLDYKSEPRSFPKRERQRYDANDYNDIQEALKYTNGSADDF